MKTQNWKIWPCMSMSFKGQGYIWIMVRSWVFLSKYEGNSSINEKLMTNKAKLKKNYLIGQGHIKFKVMSKSSNIMIGVVFVKVWEKSINKWMKKYDKEKLKNLTLSVKSY